MARSARIKHIEIAGREGERLRSFYGELFGWTITRRDVVGLDYYDVEPGGQPSELTAGIRHEPEGEPEIVVYIEVDDVDASVEKAQALGATVRIPPMEHGDLRFALIRDPEGNPIGLTQR
jgi:predicted enzyme related to lactoylglutathione lyase